MSHSQHISSLTSGIFSAQELLLGVPSVSGSVTGQDSSQGPFRTDSDGRTGRQTQHVGNDRTDTGLLRLPVLHNIDGVRKDEETVAE